MFVIAKSCNNCLFYADKLGICHVSHIYISNAETCDEWRPKKIFMSGYELPEFRSYSLKDSK